MSLIRYRGALAIFRGESEDRERDRDLFRDRDRTGHGPGQTKRWPLSEETAIECNCTRIGSGKDDNAVLYCSVLLMISFAQTYDDSAAQHSRCILPPGGL